LQFARNVITIAVMAHLRNRYIMSLLKRGLKHKGIVGLFGHRQVGKTTVLEQLTNNYVTFDRAIDLERSFEAPEYFLKSHLESIPLAIDECQLSPPLFPALKEHVRIDKRPGLFLLSGSVRFSSRKAIRESLTGRMLAYELLPFSVSELEEKPLNTLPMDLLNCRGFSGLDLHSPRKTLLENTHAIDYLKFGGLPGICLVRNDRDRNDLIESQIDLILDRDLRLVCDTALSLSSLKNLIRMLAQLQNVPLNLSELARKAKISIPTLRKIITGLEAIFFIRALRCEGNEVRPVLFFEDQGEASYLSSLRLSGEPGTFTNLVLDLERLAFAHLRIPFAYTPGVALEISQYRQQGGAYVPFVLRSSGKALGVICMQEFHPSLSSSRSAGSFLDNTMHSKLIYLHPGKEITLINERELVLPMALIL